jgi:arginyl-tRNA synthetase
VLASESLPAVELDRPRQADHGDLACNLAMQLARPLKQPPRKIAEALAQAVQAADAASPQPLLAAVDVAGPGFINLRLAPAARRAVVARVLEKAGAFGCGTQGAGRSVVVSRPTPPGRFTSAMAGRRRWVMRSARCLARAAGG